MNNFGEGSYLPRVAMAPTTSIPSRRSLWGSLLSCKPLAIHALWRKNVERLLYSGNELFSEDIWKRSSLTRTWKGLIKGGEYWKGRVTVVRSAVVSLWKIDILKTNDSPGVTFWHEHHQKPSAKSPGLVQVEYSWAASRSGHAESRHATNLP